MVVELEVIRVGMEVFYEIGQGRMIRCVEGVPDPISSIIGPSAGGEYL